ncbi:MAG: hypothetical protein LC620_02575 [Halobacteriales archaeon]|nr:hypothetical protein [Halobacteriales archaeon]
MDQMSGLAKASGVLLLVGAILQAVGSVFFVLAVVLLGSVFGSLQDAPGKPHFPFEVILWIYGILGAFLVAGSICSFVAYGRARKGDWQGAFVWGLVGCLLPPVSVVGLLGAIFAKVCPESEGRPQRQAPTGAWT